MHSVRRVPIRPEEAAWFGRQVPLRASRESVTELTEKQAQLLIPQPTRGWRRFLDLLQKGWVYGLSVLERPEELLFVVRSIAFSHAHAGELVRLSQHRKWIASLGIRSIIDVGAHTGEFASAIRVILPDAQIYSFEPLPDCLEVLSRKMMRHGRFRAFSVALGEAPDTTAMWRSSFSESSSLLPMTDLHKKAFPWTAGNIAVQARVETLDSFLPEMDLRPKVLLKIDVQGYEAKVIQGGEQVLDLVDFVLVEVSFQNLYVGQASFHEIYRALVARRFQYVGCLEQLSSPLDGSILQEDAFFIRRHER